MFNEITKLLVKLSPTGNMKLNRSGPGWHQQQASLEVNGVIIYYLPKSGISVRRSLRGVVFMIPSLHPGSLHYENGDYVDAQ